MSERQMRRGESSNARMLVRAFHIVATLEAVTWLGLLIGMYFKWIAKSTDLGVRIFGSLHGAVFVTFVVLSIAMYVRLGWRLRTLLLALVSSLPPFATIAFEVWAARTGRFVPGADRYSDFPSRYPTSVR
jgi:integral membrane protein